MKIQKLSGRGGRGTGDANNIVRGGTGEGRVRILMNKKNKRGASFIPDLRVTLI